MPSNIKSHTEATPQSRTLSQRTAQLGTINTGKPAEQELYEALKSILDEDDYEIISQPKDLLHIFGTYGLKPDIKIRNKHTGKIFYLETKYQGPRVNAEERATKLFTHRFVEFFSVVTGMPYHAYAIIFMGNLATDTRYTSKFPYFYDKNEYCCWKGLDDIYTLQDFIKNQVIKYNHIDCTD